MILKFIGKVELGAVVNVFETNYNLVCMLHMKSLVIILTHWYAGLNKSAPWNLSLIATLLGAVRP